MSHKPWSVPHLSWFSTAVVVPPVVWPLGKASSDQAIMLTVKAVGIVIFRHPAHSRGAVIASVGYWKVEWSLTQNPDPQVCLDRKWLVICGKQLQCWPVVCQAGQRHAGKPRLQSTCCGGVASPACPSAAL